MDIKILLGELKEFKRQSSEDIKSFRIEIKSDLIDLRKDVKSLMIFRWKIAGAAMVVSAAVSLAVELLRH